MNRDRAFSLVELLTAMAIFVVLLAILLSALGQMMKLAEISNTTSERIETAGAVLDLMRADLAEASVPLNPGDTNSLQFLLNPPADILSQSFLLPSAAFWQRPGTSLTRSGDILTVGYFVRWTVDNPGNPTPILCRLQLNPDDTLNKLYSGQTWLSDALLDAKVSGRKSDVYAGLVAEGVMGIWMRTVKEDGSTSVVWDSRSPVPGELPYALEVRIVVIDQQAMRRLTELPNYPAVSASSFESDISDFVASLPPKIRMGTRIFQTVIPLERARK